MKRIKPSVFARIKAGFKHGLVPISVLCTVGGLILGLVALGGIQLNTWGMLAILTAILIACLVIVYHFSRSVQLPEAVIDEYSQDKHYTVTFCDSASLREADELTRPFFKDSFIPVDRIEQWRIQNNRGFVAIKNEDGELCACFVIIGLLHSFLEQFICGNVVESQIFGNTVLPYDEMKEQDNVYISGVVVKDALTPLGNKRANVMIWVMLKYIENVFGLLKTRNFYAVALTPQSERLLKATGFELFSEKSCRRDDHNCYRIDLSADKWNALLSRVGDYSRMVTLELD